jgi:serine/threonine-protein kinase HipA
MDADERILVVLMDGRVLGRVYYDRSKRVRLLYDDDYITAPDAVPLSLSMPTVVKRHGNTVLGPWLEGLLPDRSTVLDRWRREFKVADLSSFALLRHIGRDVAGAAMFVPPGQEDEALAPGAIVPLRADDIADRLRRLRSNPAAWEPVTGAGQFSLAGAQAKVALHDDDGQWGLPTGRIPTTHILKLAMQDLPDQDISEYLAMRAARLAGLPVPDVSVQMFNDERAFVVKRFDRLKTSSGWTRIHQEDMCQALGLSPGRKYEIHQGPGAAQVARLIRQSVTGGRQDEDVWRFIDALIFNALIVGTDAHAKNYSFLIAPGQVRLSPLYDVNSYLPYLRPGHHPEMSMRIGSEARPDLVTGEDWRECAKKTGVSGEQLVARVRQLGATVPEAFAKVAAEDEVRAFGSPLPDKLAVLVSQQSERIKARLHT